MSNRIQCRCQFDITATGVKSNFNRNRIPFLDATGTEIRDQTAWHRSRNKQRNWETVLQVISLRSLPFDITVPVVDQGWWSFEFSLDPITSVELDGDPVGALKKDIQDVPMITGLDEQNKNISYLVANDNIFFDLVKE